MPPGRGLSLLLPFLSGALARQSPSQCTALGFESTLLKCSTCDVLESHIGESKTALKLLKECKSCCAEDKEEIFHRAIFQVNSEEISKNQDHEDFVRRKAPGFPNLDVEYVVDLPCALELSNDQTTMRTKVEGWSSQHLFEFVSAKLRPPTADEVLASEGGATGKGSAEIQSCAG